MPTTLHAAQIEARERALQDARKGNLRSILAIRASRLGDLLFVTPALRMLRQSFPEAEITLVTAPSTVAALQGCPLVDRVLGVHLKAWWRRWSCRILAPREVRRLQVDLAIPFSPDRRHRELAQACRPQHLWLPSFASQPAKITLPLQPRRSLEDRAVDWSLIPPVTPDPERLRHMVVRHVSVVQPLLAESLSEVPPLEVACSSNDRQIVAQQLEKAGLRLDEFPMALHLGFHGTRRTRSLDDAGKRAWPLEHWRTLVQMCGEASVPLVVTAGNATEVRAAQEVCHGVPRAAVLPDLSVPQLAALYGMSRVFVGLDSGPMHIAAAVGIPIVALFGPTNPDLTGPWVRDASKVRILRLDVPCSPCRGLRAECPRNQCLTLLTPEEVLDAVWELAQTQTQSQKAGR